MKSVPHSSQNTVEFTAYLPISQHSPYPHSSSPEPPLEEERLRGKEKVYPFDPPVRVETEGYFSRYESNWGRRMHVI